MTTFTRRERRLVITAAGSVFTALVATAVSIIAPVSGHSPLPAFAAGILALACLAAAVAALNVEGRP